VVSLDLTHRKSELRNYEIDPPFLLTKTNVEYSVRHFYDTVLGKEFFYSKQRLLLDDN